LVGASAPSYLLIKELQNMPALYPFIDYTMLAILVFIAYKIIKLD
jgi:hypothetical protein